MSRGTRGIGVMVVAGVLLGVCVAVAQAPGTPNEVRPLFLWGSLACAFGLLVGVLESTRH